LLSLNPLLLHLRTCFLIVSDQVLDPHKSADKIKVLLILLFTFPDRKRLDKDSERNGSRHYLNLVCYVKEQAFRTFIVLRDVKGI